MSIEIVRASVDDVDELVPLFSAYRAFYRAPTDSEQERAFLSRRLVLKESVAYLARFEGVAAGFVQLYPSWSSVRMCRKWILNDLYVEERFRRAGVGRALLLRSVDHARESVDPGAPVRMDLKTDVTNDAARALYEREGWVLDEKFLTYAFPF